MIQLEIARFTTNSHYKTWLLVRVFHVLRRSSPEREEDIKGIYIERPEAVRAIYV